MPDRTRIKICGLRTPEMARAAVDAGADAVGVVFAPRSPRYVSIDAANAIAAEVESSRVDVTGVFASPVQITAKILNTAALSVLQIHGDVTPQIVAEFAPKPVVAAVTFRAADAVDKLRIWEAAFRDGANLTGVLIDAPDPTGIGGGAGESFDWSALRAVIDEVNPSVPLFLAGGLTPDNVAEAIATVRPYAVDVSSGVESSRGVKDASLIRAFCDAVRSA